MMEPRKPGDPPPPPWLDPALLGANELQKVPAENVVTISGGARGIINYLSDPRHLLSTSKERRAYVVFRKNPDRRYVYSREQFLFSVLVYVLSTGARIWADELIRRVRRQFSKALKDKAEAVFAQSEAYAQQWGRSNEDDEYVVATIFDMHEYAGSDEVSEGVAPTSPAIARNHKGTLVSVYAPDTSRLLSLPPEQSMDGMRSPPLSLDVDSPQSPRRRTRGGRPTMDDEGDETVRDLMRTRREDTEPATRPLDVPAPENDVVRRFPHLDAPTEALELGVTFNVDVYADDTPPKSDERSEPIVIEGEPNRSVFDVTVCLVGTSHFAIESPQATIRMDRSETESTHAAFEVKVVAESVNGVQPSLTAIFIYNGRPNGSVTRPIVLNAAPGDAVDMTLSATRLDLQLDAKPPDLTIIITNPDQDGKTFQCTIFTPLLDEFKNGVTEAWTLGEKSDVLVAQYFTSFTRSGTPPEQRVPELRGAGIELFGASPKLFKRVYWELADKHVPVSSVCVISEEPYVPWELMVPTRNKPGGGIESRDPFGVTCAIGRWISESATNANRFGLPDQKVPLNDSWVFAPQYPPGNPKPLRHASMEAEFVTTRFHGDQISPAIFSKFESALEQGGRSLIHFVCHGCSPGPGAQAIFSEDKTQLSSTALLGSRVVPDACSLSRPFIFLNACEVGRMTPALIGVGGFAAAFILLGASCVVAPLWSVKDDIAYEVAQEFYNECTANLDKPFAQIFASIRGKAYAKGEDTYAAYCFYGDPLASRQ